MSTDSKLVVGEGFNDQARPKIYPTSAPDLSFGVTAHGEVVLNVNGKPATRFQADLVAAALNSKAELRNLLWLHVSKSSPQGKEWPWPRSEE